MKKHTLAQPNLPGTASKRDEVIELAVQEFVDAKQAKVLAAQICKDKEESLLDTLRAARIKVYRSHDGRILIVVEDKGDKVTVKINGPKPDQKSPVEPEPQNP